MIQGFHEVYRVYYNKRLVFINSAPYTPNVIIVLSIMPHLPDIGLDIGLDNDIGLDTKTDPTPLVASL